jgi:hypothetical protein
MSLQYKDKYEGIKRQTAGSTTTQQMQQQKRAKHNKTAEKGENQARDQRRGQFVLLFIIYVEFC